MLILASKSHTRSALLSNAGVPHLVVASPFDEEKAQLQLVNISPRKLAVKLAGLKALALSSQYPDAVVIGADQTLDFNGLCLHKSQSIDAARTTLKKLRGQMHKLHAAVSCCLGGKLIFEHAETVKLTMTNFSDAKLEHYLEEVGERILSSVGCYQIEAEGIQLFDKVEGDYFSILGLPLLPLLAFLRKIGELPK